MSTHQTDFNTPWSLHFDRDTEDYAVICDADEYDLARSESLWLPPESDPFPSMLAAMRLMVSAPKLLDALIAAFDWIDAQIGIARVSVRPTYAVAPPSCARQARSR